jgi:hypothetical protein
MFTKYGKKYVESKREELHASLAEHLGDRTGASGHVHALICPSLKGEEKIVWEVTGQEIEIREHFSFNACWADATARRGVTSIWQLRPDKPRTLVWRR